MSKPDINAKLAELDGMLRMLDREYAEGTLSGPMEAYRDQLRRLANELRERRAAGSLPSVR
jgi:hypothetical protein